MSANKHSAQVVHIGLSTNLHKLQKYTGELLPNMRLNSGEVLKIGNFPVSGTGELPTLVVSAQFIDYRSSCNGYL